MLLSSLAPYAEEITGYNHSGFRRNRWTTDYIVCIRQILVKNENAKKQCIRSL